MKSNALSMTEMPALKDLVKKYNYIIHIHDACGGQSFELEPLSEQNDSEEIYTELEQFFDNHNLSIHFYDTKKLNFTTRLK